MKHWLETLEDAGRPVERQAAQIKASYEALFKQIRWIAVKEKECEEYVLGEWTKEEIEEAKSKCSLLLPKELIETALKELNLT